MVDRVNHHAVAALGSQAEADDAVIAAMEDLDAGLRRAIQRRVGMNCPADREVIHRHRMALAQLQVLKLTFQGV